MNIHGLESIEIVMLNILTKLLEQLVLFLLLVELPLLILGHCGGLLHSEKKLLGTVVAGSVLWCCEMVMDTALVVDRALVIVAWDWNDFWLVVDELYYLVL